MRVPLIALVLATTVIPQTVEQLADRSTLVVRATVADQVVRKEGARALVTRSSLTVEECLKGRCPPRLAVRQTGGTLGRESLVLAGDAHLAVGEEVLVFLRCPDGARAEEPPACTLVGLALGKFHLQAGTHGLRATRDLSGLAPGGADSPDGQSYPDLAARVRARGAPSP